MDEVANLILGIATGIATLVIISIGLSVIFGMMGVINFAHGEFLMLGAFGTLSAVRAGLPLGVAMIVAALGVGAFGLVVERVLIRWLYGRLEATMLATFGLSLILVQGAVLIWGTSAEGLGTPLGSFQIGRYSISDYRMVMIGVATVMVAVVYWVFTRTRFGVMARAVAQRPAMAGSLGVRSELVNMVTFTFGCALAGLGGALLTPIVAVVPSMGSAYIARSFMTVVVGGPGIVSGTTASAGFLGVVERLVAEWTSPFLGQVALLGIAIIALRVMPTGLSGRWRRAL
jgi:branched-subunit amino acid ABC-type transport system permease component